MVKNRLLKAREVLHGKLSCDAKARLESNLEGVVVVRGLEHSTYCVHSSRVECIVGCHLQKKDVPGRVSL